MSIKGALPLLGVILTTLLVLLWFRVGNAKKPVVINGTPVPPLPGLDRDEIARGEMLYAQFCASCHQPDLTGTSDWKTPLPDGSFPPPPHDDSGHTWHHPDFLLVEIVALGGESYGGTMPAFSDKLTVEETFSILTFIKSHWGKETREYQWWITNNYPTPTPALAP